MNYNVQLQYDIINIKNTILLTETDLAFCTGRPTKKNYHVSYATNIVLGGKNNFNS